MVRAFKKPDGATRAVRILVDTGGGAFLVTEPIAKEFGLAIGEISEEDGEKFGFVSMPPDAWVGPLSLDFQGACTQASRR